MIPKIIHQTYKTKDLPPQLNLISKYIQSVCPTFEYRLYDDEDIVQFIKENYDEETLRLYNMINPKLGMARADYFRYLLIYKVGGFYFDIKSFPTRDLSEWADQYKFITSHWHERHHADKLRYELGEFQNWHIISEPGHPIIAQVILRIKQNIKNYSYRPYSRDVKMDVLDVTGPLCYSRAILEVKDKYQEGYLEVPHNDHLGLVYEGVPSGHHSIYTGYIENQPVVIK